MAWSSLALSIEEGVVSPTPGSFQNFSTSQKPATLGSCGNAEHTVGHNSPHTRHTTQKHTYLIDSLR
jgi:hypothetical protein